MEKKKEFVWPRHGALITARDADVAHIPIEYIPGTEIFPCESCGEPCRSAPSTTRRLNQGMPLVCSVCATAHFDANPDEEKEFVVTQDTLEELAYAEVLRERDERRN